MENKMKQIGTLSNGKMLVEMTSEEWGMISPWEREEKDQLLIYLELQLRVGWFAREFIAGRVTAAEALKKLDEELNKMGLCLDND